MKFFLISLIRFSLIGIVVIALVIVSYFILDPFKVIYQYDRFVENDAKAYIVLNQDYVSTETFELNYYSLKYNSFILGNSRSIFYQISDWKKKIGDNNSCFHFDASGESLFALHKKMLFIDSKVNYIDNVILVLDYELLRQYKPFNIGPLYEVSPKLMNNSNFYSFHLNHLKAFFSPSFFFPAIYFLLTKEPPPLNNNTLDYRPRNYDPITNELKFDKIERLIEESKYYTKKKVYEFYERDTNQIYCKQSIFDLQKKMLEDINNIFIKFNTNYKIIISPLYDQRKLNTKDLKYLYKLFGKDNVFDFSGINNYTLDYKNYYETSHYRPHVARDILNEIYN